MSRISTLDLAFLVLESQKQPMHMSSCLVLEPPARGGSAFARRLVEAFRKAEPGEPFNQRVKWLDRGVARWETARPDPRYHVRHVALPSPGTRAQLDDTLALLNAPLLDRAYPLWQCFVIEGLEHQQVAIFTKLHHSLIDGEGAIKLMRASLSDNPRSRTIRALWDSTKQRNLKQAGRVSTQESVRLRSQLNGLPAGLLEVTSGLLELGAQALKLKPQQASLPFQAPATPFNVQLTSSARCYANCEIPLERVRSIAKSAGCTVNDAALAFIDHSLHKYLAETGASVTAPLVASIPLSTRVKGEQASGNQVMADLVPLGSPDASIVERLREIHESTGRVKDRAKNMSAAMRQTYVMLLLGMTAIPELMPGVHALPSSNVLISNMAGPPEQLYLGGAPVRAMLGLPILPPSPCLNITFLSMMGKICLGVASTPEAMANPGRYVELLQESLSELEQALELAPTRPTAKRAAAAGRRPRKPAQAKITRKKAAPK